MFAEGLDPLEQKWLADLINFHLQRGERQSTSGSPSTIALPPPREERSGDAGRRFDDFVSRSASSSARDEADRAVQAAEAAGAQARQAAAQAERSARLAGEWAAAEAQRSVGRFGGSAWDARRQQQQQQLWQRQIDESDELMDPWDS